MAHADQSSLLHTEPRRDQEKQMPGGLGQAFERERGGEADRMPEPAQREPGFCASHDQARELPEKCAREPPVRGKEFTNRGVKTRPLEKHTRCLRIEAEQSLRHALSDLVVTDQILDKLGPWLIIYALTNI